MEHFLVQYTILVLSKFGLKMVEFNLKLFLVELSTISRTNLIRIENKNSWVLSFERLNVKEKSDDAVNILCCCQGYNARKFILDKKSMKYSGQENLYVKYQIIKI